jgi:hypothetical protein
MILPEVIEKVETQLLNVPVRIEQISLSGYSIDWIQKCYPSSEFQKSYWNLLLGDLNQLIQSDMDVKSSDFSGQASILTESLPSYFESNLQGIKDSFSKELSMKKESIKTSLNLITETFDRISKFISELNFEFGNVEIINSDYLKFTLLFPEKKLLLITKSIFPDRMDFGSDEVIFSFFINRKLVASDVSEFPILTKGFKKYFAM